MVELVAVDMGDILLGPDGHISACNAHVTRCMQNVGVELLTYMGRSYADALLSLEEAGLRVVVVCMNGASVYDRKGWLTHKQELARSQMEHILECRRNKDVIFDFMIDRGSCTIAGEEELRECFEHDTLLPMAGYPCENIRRRFTLIPLGELFCRRLRLYKTSVIHESHQVLGQVKKRLKAVEDLAVAPSLITSLKLTHIEAQKGKALAAYASMKNIRLDQVMAIGDSENDYFMPSMNLKYTAAMGNTMEHIKNTTKCQTCINAQDGVVYAIENLVLYKEADRV